MKASNKHSLGLGENVEREGQSQEKKQRTLASSGDVPSLALSADSLYLMDNIVAYEGIVGAPPTSYRGEHSATERIIAISMEIGVIKESLNSVRMEQHTVLAGMPAVNPTDIQNTKVVVENLQQRVKLAINNIEEVFSSHVLSAKDSRTLYSCKSELEIDMTHLSVLHHEIDLACNGSWAPVAKLVIYSQPFPDVVKQKKAIDDEVKVRMITGAAVTFSPGAKVLAKVQSKGFSNQSIHNAVAEMDERGEAIFSKLMLPFGTRLNPISLVFISEVELNGALVELNTEPSKPFIVMTNDGQRPTAAGKLVKEEIFGVRGEVAWAKFINTIHMHYLDATKQDQRMPSRPLTMSDKSYLHKLLGFSNFLTKDDYDAFWEKFGTILYKVRNGKKLLKMWTRGLIYGFITRDQANSILEKEEPGTFLVRFSERSSELFVIAWVKQSEDDNSQRELHHNLIYSDELEKETLPDLLQHFTQLKVLLQVVFNEAHEATPVRRDKMEVLRKEKLLSATKPRPDIHGYNDVALARGGS